MLTGWSERIRDIADREYVRGARLDGGSIHIPLGELQATAEKQGLPRQRTPLVASAIETEKFWRPRGLEMVSPKGQPRRVKTVFEFRPVKGAGAVDWEQDPLLALCGMLKGAIGEGADAFVRDIRRDKAAG